MLWILKYLAAALVEQNFAAIFKTIALVSHIVFTAIFPQPATFAQRFEAMPVVIPYGLYCEVHSDDQECILETAMRTKYKADQS